MEEPQPTNWVAGEWFSNDGWTYHDMIEGPCACGAWHHGEGNS